jgi:NAD-dependent SIR2 family protein deacetylase
MPLKIHTYHCSNGKCKIKDQQVELCVHSELIDIQKCEACQKTLVREVSGPKGFVKGTMNPCRG